VYVNAKPVRLDKLLPALRSCSDERGVRHAGSERGVPRAEGQGNIVVLMGELSN